MANENPAEIEVVAEQGTGDEGAGGETQIVEEGIVAAAAGEEEAIFPFQGQERMMSIKSAGGDEYAVLEVLSDDETFGQKKSTLHVLDFGSRIPYSSLYSSGARLLAGLGSNYLSKQPVTAKIIDAQRDTTYRYTFNPYLYHIEVTHGNFKWIVRRRYKHFRDLNDKLWAYRASTKIPIPSKKLRERKEQFVSADKEVSTVPQFPKRPEPMITVDTIEKRKEQLETYLNAVLESRKYRDNGTTKKFLDISKFSFVEDLGKKSKEGVIMKKSGSHKTKYGLCERCCQIKTKRCVARWRKSWFVVKDNFLLYTDLKHFEVRGVFLIDNHFTLDREPGSSRITIANQSRRIKLWCWTERQANEWQESIEECARNFASGLSEHQIPNDSFAPPRPDSYAYWFVDGRTYFEAAAEAINAAQEEIFITDWWLSPQIYLKRPVRGNDDWRLDHLLKRKATEGVKIYVQLYKEVKVAIGLQSGYTKQVLEALHPNVCVLRHPDFSTEKTVLWAHHEKILVIDQSTAFVGGIDLCYGRWDFHEHRLTDLGIDFTATDGGSSGLNKSAIPFGMFGVMAMGLVDQASAVKAASPVMKNKREKQLKTGVRSRVKQRWNSKLHRKDKKPSMSSNATPTHTVTTPLDEAPAEPPADQPADPPADQPAPGDQPDPSAGPSANPDDESKPAADDPPKLLQVVAQLLNKRRTVNGAHPKKSVSINLEAQVTEIEPNVTETDQAAEEIEPHSVFLDQYKDMTTKFHNESVLWAGKDYANFLFQDLSQLEDPFSDQINRQTHPRMPWHDIACVTYGRAARDVGRHFIQRWNYTKNEKRRKRRRVSFLIPKSYADSTFIIPRSIRHPDAVKAKVQVLRSSCEWSAGLSETPDCSIQNAYVHLIENSQHYVYIENQFFITVMDSSQVRNRICKALYNRIVRAHKEGKRFRVYVVMPLLPGFEGDISDSSKSRAIRAVLYWQYKSINRGLGSLMGELDKTIGHGQALNYITFCGLRQHGELGGKPITEIVYVHSKLLIVDDRFTIIGSANVNDRSLSGTRDSEVCLLIEDTKFVTSTMDGNPYEVGVYSARLRRRVYCEHLGLLPDDFDGTQKTFDPLTSPTAERIDDIACDTFFKDVWLRTASVNTGVYEKVFSCIPSDNVRKREQSKEYQSKALIHTDIIEARNFLEKVRGNLVLLPLFFLIDEDLAPEALTKEGLAPMDLWT